MQSATTTLELLTQAQLTQAQQQRLLFIDFCLNYFGEIARADLIAQFQTGLASCTRDLALYKELAPANLELKHHTKLYYRTAAFSPLFSHNDAVLLSRLSDSASDCLPARLQHHSYSLDAIRLLRPRCGLVPVVLQAIYLQQAVHCRYVSLSSGEQERELVPHTLVNNGHRWHLRAFDRKHGEFRDFVLNRLLQVRRIESEILPQQQRGADAVWQQICQITLQPHPGHQYPQAIALDYNMQQGRLVLEVRAAVLGYLLQQWQVDCSPDASLDCRQYPLALADHQILTQVADLTLFPGANLR
ncbi:WYL domain-containing protein [Rheinheimera riviphila]|uniref:WYL domain-containing protein n=1 Tax=Rheinheimera riviphila TaxID=1834037 RepID=A0A437QIX9_9GAMM|nr:WYL domain-containing protein [Rheinheimera riviphila]RVU34340.1 WYL domain-containing protein [Rheinheimera riviphila]